MRRRVKPDPRRIKTAPFVAWLPDPLPTGRMMPCGPSHPHCAWSSVRDPSHVVDCQAPGEGPAVGQPPPQPRTERHPLFRANQAKSESLSQPSANPACAVRRPLRECPVGSDRSHPWARGGIGRREGLRILWSNPCRFDPCRAHHSGFLERRDVTGTKVCLAASQFASLLAQSNFASPPKPPQGTRV